VLGLRHSYCAPSRLVTTAYCTWRWCLGYGSATVRLCAWCLQLTPHDVGAWATAQLGCALARSDGSLLHLTFVLGLRHIYESPSRLVSSGYCNWRCCLGYGTPTVRLRAWCLQLTPPGVGAWDTAKLRCALARSDGSLLHLAFDLGLRHSYGAPSRLVTTAYCTWRWCLSYGPATVRLRACCLLLSAPGVGA